jgi:hypothetical protein
MFLKLTQQYRVTGAGLAESSAPDPSATDARPGKTRDNVTPGPPTARKGNMTSISALSTNHASPLQRLQTELQAEVSSGAINSSDQSALSSALGDITSALQSSDQSGGSRPKISDLIQQEVSAGKLTSQQATELEGIFKAAHAHGHHHGAGGPQAAASANDTDASSTDNTLLDQLQQFFQSLANALTNATSSGATGSGDTANPGGSSPANATDGSSTGTSATDQLQQFLQSLKASLADPTYSAAGSGGANANDPSLSGVLINDRI